MSELINTIMRDICELDEAWLDGPSTIIVNSDAVRNIVESHVSQLESEREWVSCEERLPEKNERVWWSYPRIEGYFEGFGGDGRMERDNHQPSHWFPRHPPTLPQGPTT